MYWEKLSFDQMNQRISEALGENTSFRDAPLFGVPGSWLNRRVFPPHKFLEKAPFLRTMVENPNHIGCHTSGTSESFFKGTHVIEKEVLRICAEEILCAEKDSYDGYIATGGTEGNIQGIWAYRNYLMEEKGVTPSQIAVIYSADTHYSLHKACNLLCVEPLIVDVDENSRQMVATDLKDKIQKAKAAGVKEFISVLSMGTTMFGSVDRIDDFLKVLQEVEVKSFIHIDAAFGGFSYPFSKLNQLTFNCPEICSFSLDGHKMLQSPYGTGLFLIRKPFLKYVSTEKASYVKGFDQTLCGSRSGAHSVAMWMILSSYGSEGWTSFIKGLQDNTKKLCLGLEQKGITYFREPGVNVVTVKAGQIDTALLNKYHWVSDDERNPTYYKAVVMDHVKAHEIADFLDLI